MLTSKHTPTPWKRGHYGGLYPLPENANEHGGPVIGQCIKPEDERFIARACNSHDELVAACKRAKTRLLEMGQRESCRTIRVLDAAIATAEEST